MKKIKFILLGLFIMFLPLLAYAEGTSRYYIEVNVLENGDAEVKELKLMDGYYNGYKTNIRYKTNNLKNFTGVLDDFEGSNIYNASMLTDLKVYDVDFNTTKFSVIDNKINEFKLTTSGSAQKGDYGVYTQNTTSEGEELVIYLPSKYKRASLVTYTLKDLVVVHNDVAELAHDFIGSDYEENINNLIIRINLPKASNTLRIFSHGPLNGSNKIIDNKTTEITYETLYSYNAVDGRVVFDKEVVPYTSKKSNVDGFDKILEVEAKRAQKANNIREDARKKEKRINLIENIIKVLSIVWFVGLVIIAFLFYKKNDKEYGNEFNVEYFRDFPSDYLPTTVDYLMNKKINNLSFSASILELIRKKAILVEEFVVIKKSLFKDKEEKDYKFSKNPNFDIETLKDSEKKLYELLINTIGNGTEVILSEMKKSTSDYEIAKCFVSDYETWKYKSMEEAEKEGFYENIGRGKIKAILYALIFPVISIITFIFNLNIGVGYILSIIGIISIIYFALAIKRTKYGNEQYHKWKGLKNFLVEFGSLDEKSLPEIKLWERYLVYATVFGIADKVQKAMKMNLDNMNYTEDTDFTYLYFDDYYFANRLNLALVNSEASARRTISDKETASSSDSSSGGFGGGSSFGGGGFGGGSGGGRF